MLNQYRYYRSRCNILLRSALSCDVQGLHESHQPCCALQGVPANEGAVADHTHRRRPAVLHDTLHHQAADVRECAPSPLPPPAGRGAPPVEASFGKACHSAEHACATVAGNEADTEERQVQDAAEGGACGAAERACQAARQGRQAGQPCAQVRCCHVLYVGTSCSPAMLSVQQ